MQPFDKNSVALNTDVTFDQFIDPMEEKSTIDSRNFPLGSWRDVCKFHRSVEGVSKFVVPINIKEYCMLVISEADPGTKVKKHSHDEGLIRYVMKGSLVQNGVRYEAGDWVFLPQGQPYELYTEEGYTAMCVYRTWCKDPD